MPSTNIDEQVKFAEGRVHAAEAAVIGQIELIDRLTSIKANVASALISLKHLEVEVVEWKSFRNMVRIKFEMLSQTESA